MSDSPWFRDNAWERAREQAMARANAQRNVYEDYIKSIMYVRGVQWQPVPPRYPSKIRLPEGV